MQTRWSFQKTLTRNLTKPEPACCGKSATQAASQTIHGLAELETLKAVEELSVPGYMT